MTPLAKSRKKKETGREKEGGVGGEWGGGGGRFGMRRKNRVLIGEKDEVRRLRLRRGREHGEERRRGGGR